MITEQQMRALVFLAAAARPHGARRWDEAGTMAVLRKLANRRLTDVGMALLRAADDREANTPNVLLAPTSPHWRERDTGWTPRPERIDPALLCDTCGRPQHPEVDHPFEPAGRARGRRLPPDQAAEIAAELRDRLQGPATAGPSPFPEETPA